MGMKKLHLIFAKRSLNAKKESIVACDCLASYACTHRET